MVLRQARLTAWLLLATIAVLALWSLAWFGADHLLPVRAGRGTTSGIPVWEAALRFPGMALLWTAIYLASARVPRWRRNIVRAGNAFAAAWVSTMTLILAVQILMLAAALGYDIDRGSAFAAIVGILLLYRANALPKSRPAWFNGIALPIFASRTDVWRRVHRASAWRLVGIALLALSLAAFAPQGTEPMRIVIPLLLLELAFASLHGLWLGVTTVPEPHPSETEYS
jgi:uncharacterized membrane protein